MFEYVMTHVTAFVCGIAIGAVFVEFVINKKTNDFIKSAGTCAAKDRAATKE